jgi:hypothetical protein
VGRGQSIYDKTWAQSASILHKRMGRNHTISSHWATYLTSNSNWCPVPAISPQTFSSVVGGYFIVQMTMDVVLILAAWRWLGRHYPGRWIDRCPEAPVLCPPRSPDLNPIDLNLWGSMKNAVYTSAVDTRGQLGNAYRMQQTRFVAHVGVRTCPSRVPTSFLRLCPCLWHFEHFL